MKSSQKSYTEAKIINNYGKYRAFKTYKEIRDLGRRCNRDSQDLRHNDGREKTWYTCQLGKGRNADKRT